MFWSGPSGAAGPQTLRAGSSVNPWTRGRRLVDRLHLLPPRVSRCLNFAGATKHKDDNQSWCCSEETLQTLP